MLKEKIHTTTHRPKRFCPFPGLRPFKAEESFLFFGRNEQSDEAASLLLKNHFLAIVGPSGSGKSSFTYCGFLPALYRASTSLGSTHWHVINVRPGQAAVMALAQALEQTFALSSMPAQASPALAAHLMSHTQSLWQYLQAHNHDHRPVLLLIDQFEELFRALSTPSESNAFRQAQHFLLLLEEVIGQLAGSRLFVCLTLRADFIGECANYPALTEAINSGSYMLPQLTRTQREEVICGPIQLAGASITPRLVQRLLNDIGEQNDQLPVLQHALMRTWQYWQQHRSSPGEPLDLPHYLAIGGMQEALSIHAEEAFSELSERQQLICEKLFKTITEKSGNSNLGIRRPTSVGVISKIAGCPPQEVIEVVEHFRRSDRSFLTPALPAPLTEDSVIDLSHEALMRIWRRLRQWVEEERDSIRMYLRLCEASELYQIGKANLWRPPDLLLALNWREKNQPTLEWGIRHHPAFERAMLFLDFSLQEYETEERIKRRQQKKRLRRARQTALLFALLTIISLGFLIYAFVKRTEAEQQRRIAIEQKQEAEQQRLLAEQREEEARRNAQKAREEEQRAIAQKQEAERQRRIAEFQKQEAERQRQLALQNEQIAIEQEGIARQNAALAEAKRIEAEQNYLEAERQRARARRQRLLSIAKAMALKSLQVVEDAELQGLLAQQAASFHLNNGGSLYDPDIYRALYYALRNYKGSDFNRLAIHQDMVRSMVSHPQRAVIYSCGSDGRVFAINTGQVQQSKLIAQMPGVQKSLAITPEGQFLAVGGDNSSIQIYQTGSLKLHTTIQLPAGSGTRFLAYGMHNGQAVLLFVLSDNTFYIYRHGDESVEKLPLTTAHITDVALTADAQKIFFSTVEGKIWEYTLADGQTQEIWSSRLPVSAFAISPDRQHIAIGLFHGQVYFMNLDSHKKVRLYGHSREITDIAFDASGEHLATASRDRSVRVWRLRALNEEPLLLDDYQSWATALCFTPDGLRLFAGAHDHQIRFWFLDIQNMGTQLCQYLKHNLSKEEWQRYVSEDIPYEETCAGLPPRHME